MRWIKSRTSSATFGHCMSPRARSPLAEQAVSRAMPSNYRFGMPNGAARSETAASTPALRISHHHHSMLIACAKIEAVDSRGAGGVLMTYSIEVAGQRMWVWLGTGQWQLLLVLG